MRSMPSAILILASAASLFSGCASTSSTTAGSSGAPKDASSDAPSSDDCEWNRKSPLACLRDQDRDESREPAAAESDAKGEELLKKADAIRNPSAEYKMRIKVKSEDSAQEFEVLLKGTDKTLIVTKDPPKDRGRNMLMLDRDFYTYVPNLKRSLRLSLAQKMSGQVANGDIARTRWAGDYSVAIEEESSKEIRLLLSGNKKNLTYDKIRLWIEAKSARPIRAEYLSLDGRTVLKKASFDRYKKIAGDQRPTLLRIQDTGGQESTISIESMDVTKLEDSLFTTTQMEKAR